MAKTKTPLQRAMALAVAGGLRAALAPALLESSRRAPRAGLWTLAALGEMVLDKARILPLRHHPAILVPHAISGAWAAREVMREEGIDDPSAPVMGAVVAAGVAGVAPIARAVLSRGLGVSDAVLGLAEDYLALKLGGEAAGMTFSQMGAAVGEAVGELRDQVAPNLEFPSWPESTFERATR